MSDVLPLSLNRPQVINALLSANVHTEIGGRGGGKSTDIAKRMKAIAELMPRSTNVYSSATFSQALTITLMPVFASLNRLGWVRNIHYVIGTKPPATWKDLPYEAPADWSKFITFKTGAGYHIASQDRDGSNRGRNVDSIIGDEMLNQNKGRFENEIMTSNRGNDKIFKNVSLHHSVYLKSSMPTGADSMWLLDHGKYYEDDGYPLWELWNKLCSLYLALVDSDNDDERLELINQIAEHRKHIRFYKKYFDEENGKKVSHLFTLSNVFDNLDNVSISYIKQLRRSEMSDLAFRIEVLNWFIQKLEQSFYKLEEKHFYTKYNYSFIDSLDYDPEKIKNVDSRRDEDLQPDKPIKIAIDYGGHIIAGWACQNHLNDFLWLRASYVKYPKSVEEWVAEFCEYYKHHKTKRVLHRYDHTAIGIDNRYQERTKAAFIKHKWSYTEDYVGHTPDPEPRFDLWDALLQHRTDKYPRQLFHRVNCKYGILSMQLAGIKQGSKGFQKDKSSERSKIIPREQATDFSDAADIMAWGEYKNSFKSYEGFMATRFSSK